MHENGEEINNFGFGVRTTRKGSMQQDIFLDYAVHFVNHLPPDQGKNKKPVILIMDGHNSRWTLNALHYLSQNNVWTFFLPSHTSIVTQPNDCNVNKDVHRHISIVADKMNNMVHTCSVTVLNVIIFKAWEGFLEEENTKFIKEGENNTIVAWRNCGYFPFNKNCLNWKSELDKLNDFDDARHKEYNSNANSHDINTSQMYEVVPISNENNNDFVSITSENERNLFFDGYKEYEHGKGSIIRVSYLRAKNILKRWYEENDCTKNPHDFCNGVGDNIAMKHMKFILTSSYNIVHNIMDAKKKYIDEALKIRKKKYLSQMKKIVDSTKVKYTTTDGHVINGLLTKRSGDTYQIELENEEILKFTNSDDILQNKLVSLVMENKSDERIMKQLANMKENVEEEEVITVGKIRYEAMLITEYQKIQHAIQSRDLRKFTYKDFLLMRKKISSAYEIEINGRTVTIEPTNIGLDDMKIYSVGNCVMDSVKEVFSCMHNQKKLADARVAYEIAKQKKSTLHLKETIQSLKRKCVDYDKNDNNCKKTKILINDVNEENNDADDNMNASFNTSSKNECNKKISRTPKTKYGEDGIAIENFLSYVDRKNDVFFKK
jgi:hypothetical protein